MTPLRIATIVEGYGEAEAVPILIRRFADLLGWPGRIQIVSPPIRQPASKLLFVDKQGKRLELARIIELAILKLNGPGGIFLLLDCEDDCPARLGPELLAQMKNVRPDLNLPVSVVLAYKEYESWFLGAAASIGGHRDLPANLHSHPKPESPRNCKGWLSKQMPRGRRYDEITDQAAFTSIFDFDAARQACPSFDKCHRELTALLQNVAAITPGFSPKF